MSSELQRAAPLYQQIYHLLRQRILEGMYPPGSPVLESRLALALDVSRTPVREALRQLEREGLVVAHGSDLMVANPSQEEFLDLYTCRAALEHIVAERAARQATEHDIATMRQALDEATAAIEHGEHAQVIAANTRFHDRMVLSTRMPSLRLLMDSIRGPILVARRNVLANSRATEMTVLHEHEDMLHAIAQHNVALAQTCMDTHMRNDMARGGSNLATLPPALTAQEHRAADGAGPHPTGV